MAKRRKEKDEEEDKPFKIPKFDEEAFLKRERRNIKTTFISFLFGLLLAVICFGFWALMGKNDFRWELVLLVGVVNAAFLKYLFARLNIDLTDFARKNWFGCYAVYFFSWLILFVVLVNPPFYDDEAPNVDLAVLPGIQEPGGDIVFAAKITDNVGVDKDTISLVVTDPDETETTLAPDSFEHDDMIVSLIFENTENILGDFTYTLTVNDVNGHSTVKSGIFTYDDEAIEIKATRFENLTHSDDITIEVNKDISPYNFRVYYTLDDSDEINVDRKYLEVNEEYETSPEYEGWAQNSNYTMKAFAEVSYYFINVRPFTKYSNIVEDTTTKNFTTTTDEEIGELEPSVTFNWSKSIADNKNTLNYDTAKDTNGDGAIDPDSVLLPYPREVSAPGFEAIVFFLALIAVALIFKYRKKNKK